MEKKELRGGKALDICSGVSSRLFPHMSLCVCGGGRRDAGQSQEQPRTAAGKLEVELLSRAGRRSVQSYVRLVELRGHLDTSEGPPYLRKPLSNSTAALAERAHCGNKLKACTKAEQNYSTDLDVEVETVTLLEGGIGENLLTLG